MLPTLQSSQRVFSIFWLNHSAILTTCHKLYGELYGTHRALSALWLYAHYIDKLAPLARPCCVHNCIRGKNLPSQLRLVSAFLYEKSFAPKAPPPPPMTMRSRNKTFVLEWINWNWTDSCAAIMAAGNDGEESQKLRPPPLNGFIKVRFRRPGMWSRHCAINYYGKAGFVAKTITKRHYFCCVLSFAS